VVEPVSCLHPRHGRDEGRPLAVTQQGHRVGVAAEMGHVEPDPFQRCEQVAQGVVATSVRIARACNVPKRSVLLLNTKILKKPDDSFAWYIKLFYSLITGYMNIMPTRHLQQACTLHNNSTVP
jgi:hypothetical protein